MSKKPKDPEILFHPVVKSRDVLLELGIGREHFYQAVESGEIKATRMGHKYVVPREEVERLKKDGVSPMRKPKR